MIPRIQGKVGQIEEDLENPEHTGKWVFTVWLSFIGATEPEEMGTWGPFDTQDIAKAELDKCAQFMCEKFEEDMDGGPSGKYWDMKDGKLKPWVKH